ncbi:MAG: type IV secretory system conjugative DNA transfer family protein [Bacteroidales bacterium]|nr:type IV secretory system conjugative DNA transfer family protein [Bacteroidales bacterium]
MAQRQEYEKMYIAAIIFAVVILLANIYYYCHPLLRTARLTWPPLDYLMKGFHGSGIFSHPLKTKGIAMLFLMLCSVIRSGKGKKVETGLLVGVGLFSLAFYCIPFHNPLLYLIATIVGATGLVWTFAMIGRIFAGFHEHGNDLKESFEQEKQPYPNDWSVVLPTRYFYQKNWHQGYITVGNPFRGTLVVGSAGSGKSFSVFNPFIEQMIAHGYTMMLYDFKMPDLTKIVYNSLLRSKSSYKKLPQFYCINFKDPLKSNRCNPIAAEYLTDIIDASETARVVMEALNKGNEKKDFFWMSAQQYIGICLWLLRIYTPQGRRQGDWCDFPHLIELINQDYTKVLSIVKRQPALDGKARVFVDALEANAQDQLQGQIASARIPLNDIASPALYWVLSGNDFNLDINDPEDPKILCIGNDPDRQQVYGAALSLFTFRVIKRVNRKGKLPCAVVIDELPTISVQGLDGLMATARSNKVAVVLGIQDLTQVKADYGDKVADKILALPANVFVGASSVTTAEKYSKEFGKEFRRQESQTRSIDSESVNISFHEEEVMPIRKITSLPQGTFIGKVAIENNSPVKQPFFCGAIQIDLEEFKRKEKEAKEIPDLSDFELGDLWRQVSVPEIGRIYILDHLKDTIRAEWKREHRPRYSEAELQQAADARLAAMSDAECEAMLRGMIPELEQKEIARIIEDNFYAIKGDIRELIEQECPPEEEEAYVEETTQENNQ